jgi:predicted Na+-dependent transporter
MLKIIKTNAYIFVMALAALAGYLVPQTEYLSGWNTLFLQIIFFISCLRLDLHLIYAYIKDWRFLLGANAVMLIGFPILVGLINLFAPTDLGFAVFLLAAMPIGMTAPLLVELAGLKNESTMVLTVTTALIAPFTIPFLVKIFHAGTVFVSASEIFWQLVLVIFIPFVLAVGVRSLLKINITRFHRPAKTASLILLGLIISGAVGKNISAGLDMALNPLYLLLVFGVLYAFFGATIIIGYYAFYWESKETRAGASLSLACMNFTLAIYLSSKFFPQPGVILPLIVAIIPWATVMPIWKHVLGKRIRLPPI